MVIFDNDYNVTDEQCANAGLKLIRYEFLLSQGSKFKEIQKQEPKSNSVFFIGITSGTTKKPKLVMLTHKNFISGQVCQKFFGFNLNEKDCYYSFSPLNHVFE